MPNSIELVPGFTGVANSEVCNKAFAMPLNDLAKVANEAFREQAFCSHHSTVMIELIRPHIEAEDGPVMAAVMAIKNWLTQWDNEMCRTAGLMEAVVLRLNQATPSSTPGTGASEAGS
jgi:hypothetical protein